MSLTRVSVYVIRKTNGLALGFSYVSVVILPRFVLGHYGAIQQSLDLEPKHLFVQG